MVGNNGTNWYHVQSVSQMKNGLTLNRKRGETQNKAKLKEELKIPRMRGSIQMKNIKERKLWKSKLKTVKTTNLQSLLKRSLVVAKNHFDLASVTEQPKKTDSRMRNSATKRPRIWRSQCPQPTTRGACRAVPYFCDLQARIFVALSGLVAIAGCGLTTDFGSASSWLSACSSDYNEYIKQ